MVLFDGGVGLALLDGSLFGGVIEGFSEELLFLADEGAYPKMSELKLFG